MLRYLRSLSDGYCFSGGDESGLNLQSVAEERIDELNHAVNNMLSSYPEINSNGIRNSLAILTERLKCEQGYSYICVISNLLWYLYVICV